MLCPFCELRESDSDDHVFPQFLGGGTAIRACSNCNNTFGHTIEAAASRHFAEWMFILRRCGMKPPRPHIWKRIGPDASGQYFDIDQDFVATRSEPQITRDSKGNAIGFNWSPEKLAKIIKNLQSEGRTVRIVRGEKIRMDLRQIRLQHPMDDDIKRLCIKVSLGCTEYFGLPNPLDQVSKDYLSSKIEPGSRFNPVQISHLHYQDVDKFRPPVGHLIYVRADSTTRKVWSVVQFFSAQQFFCTLNNNWDGVDFSILGTHDPVTHLEEFKRVDPFNLQPPPMYVQPDFFRHCMQARLERLRQELVDLYGDQAPRSLRVNL